MLLSSFAHRLLVVFSLILFFTFIVVAGHFGMLGESFSASLMRHTGALRLFYADHKEFIDPALKWVGFWISLYGAIWTVHKSWHYAERNLPARLEELNARWKDQVVRGRVVRLPALNQIATIALPPLIQPGYFARLTLWFHDAEQKNLIAASQALDKHEAEFRVLQTCLDRCRAEITTAYLEIGSTLARCASDNPHAAFNSFRKPLEFDGKDLDALELSARQAFAIGFERPALKYLSELAVAAAESSDQIRHYRALRFQAEILHGGDTQSSWADARARLTGVIAALTSADGIKPLARNCELALAHELLADVQITRERFTAADAALVRAKTLFSALPPPHGSEGLNRLKTLADRLSRAKADADNQSETD
jgi:hypothetical protein